jgi:hypothetical protein
MRVRLKFDLVLDKLTVFCCTEAADCPSSAVAFVRFFTQGISVINPPLRVEIENHSQHFSHEGFQVW